MKLTILDGHAVNPGDLPWDEFRKYADVTIYERTPENLVAERIGDSAAVFLNKIKITENILSACPNLKYIGVLGFDDYSRQIKLINLSEVGRNTYQHSLDNAKDFYSLSEAQREELSGLLSDSGEED